MSVNLAEDFLSFDWDVSKVVIRCDDCGRFVTSKDVYVDEVGDYGQVYSRIALCKKCR